MCIDEERELTIPPSTHAHKNIGMKDDVPKDAVLQFQVRLLDINGSQRKSQYKRWKARDEQRVKKKRKQASALGVSVPGTDAQDSDYRLPGSAEL